MTGVDGADLLRQVELQPDDEHQDTLIMTDEYKARVGEMHAKLEEQANELREQRYSKLVLGTD